MFHRKLAKHSLEVLEQRIAPATVIPFNEAGLKPGSVGTPLLLHAGEGLTTGNGAGSGTYLLFVEAGSAIVFTTDFNNNKVIDYNEITGIAAGDGLRLLSFVDIHGDIVTNLKSDNTLSDSDNNPLNNNTQLRGDGLVLLHSSIDKIELRSLQASDIQANATTDQDGNGVVDQSYLIQRLALSSYSIFGSVLVGGTFGSSTGGLIINTAGKALQQIAFNGGNTSPDFYHDFKPEIGSIKTGTAASGQYFNFGVSRADDVQGTLTPFQPGTGESGGDIINVRASDAQTTFNIGSLESGKGGLGAHGGNIVNVQLNGDTAGGYKIIAGNGGDGPIGGAGGAITNFSDLGSITSQVTIKSGDGGVGSTGAGGAGGVTTFGTLNLSAGLKIKLGNGGDGFTSGGNGASLGSAVVITPEGAVPTTLQMVGTAASNNIPSAVFGLVDTNATVNTAGDGATSAEQTIQLVTGTSAFSLTLSGEATMYLPNTATALDVQNALDALPTFHAAGKTVTVTTVANGFHVHFDQTGAQPAIQVESKTPHISEVQVTAVTTQVGSTVIPAKQTIATPAPAATNTVFSIFYNGVETGGFLPTATAAQIQTAINGLPGFGTTNPVTVAASAGGFTISFTNAGSRHSFIVKTFTTAINGTANPIVAQYLDVPDAATLAGRSFFISYGGRAITTAFQAGAPASSVDAKLDLLIPGGVNVTYDPVATSYRVTFNTATSVRPLTIEATAQVQDNFGNNVPVDFNQDGVGDFVYSTANPDQLVVMIGTPITGFNQFVTGTDELGNQLTNRIYLNGPSNITAMIVSDFNGDGHQDIAVASADAGAFGGVYVYLSKYEDTNGDGVVSPAEDLNHNGKNDFLGFNAPRISALPSLYSTDPNNGGILGFRRSGAAISDLLAGDFDGDGITDLAAVATYYGTNTASTQQLVILKNDIEGGKLTGNFYADFGVKQAPGVNPLYLVPYISAGGGAIGSTHGEGTKLNYLDSHDSILLGTKGASNTAIRLYDYAPALGVAGNITAVSATALGRVDNDRDLTNGNNNHITLQTATLQDFTVMDTGGNGNANVYAITAAPEGFAVGFSWNNTTATFNITTSKSIQIGTNVAGVITSTLEPVNQNAGIFFGDKGLGLRGTTLVGVRATDADDDGRVNDLLILNFGYANLGVLDLVKPTAGVNSTTDTNQGSTLVQERTLSGTGDRSDSVIAFDSVAIQSLDTAKRAYIWGYGNPTENAGSTLAILFPGTGAVGRVSNLVVANKLPVVVANRDQSISISLTENGIGIVAGDGGDGLVGKGGTGGFIGSGLKTVNGDTVGSVAITIPANRAYGGKIDLNGGLGGNGFTSGGNGGSVTGTTLRYAAGDTVLHSYGRLVGGAGGFGVAGAGGNGGSVSNNSIQSGEIFVSGDGGRGLTGGNAGSIVGNGKKGLYDTQDLFFFLQTGNGGAGVKKGGDGGSITNFAPQIVGTRGSTGGVLTIEAGDGGSAISGPGGKGGSIVNSSPLVGTNFLAGEILLKAGNGAIGTVGGAGGSITGFIDKPSQLDTPTIVSILAGAGGAGITGVGGAGGGISNINIPSTGTGTSQTGYSYDRILAGDGGASGGAAGGAGGSLTNVDVSTKDGPLVLVAGAGGDGLSAGGVGGSILNSKGNIGGGGLAKVLAIAGAGGDAHAFIPNANDLSADQAKKAYGGKVGVGGNGGSISNFVQENALGAHVDLIAGNGGSTVNYGTVSDTKTYVGKGGSITNVSIAGDVGNVSAATPIKSYTDADGDGRSEQTMAQFVNTSFRSLVGGAIPDDALGNVGIVVGAAGRLKQVEVSPGVFQSVPASGGINGSLINLRANNLMSAIAGDVNQIAAIQVAQGIKIGSGSGSSFTPGIIGADKNPTVPGNDYLTSNGDPVPEPERDGRLVDGALVAHSIKDDFTGNVRVYLR